MNVLVCFSCVGQFTLPVQQNQMSGSDYRLSCVGQFTLPVQQNQMSGSDYRLSCVGQFTLSVQQNQERPMSLSNFKFEYTRLFFVCWTVHPPCPTDYIRFFKAVYNNLKSFDRNTPENQMSGSDCRLSCVGQFALPVQLIILVFFKAVYNNLDSVGRNTPDYIKLCSPEQRFTTAN